MSSSPLVTIIINDSPSIHSGGAASLSTHVIEGGQLGEISYEKPLLTYNRDRTYKNGRKAPDGIEIRFGTSRPTEATRQQLKDHGFRFSEKQTMWYAPENEKSKALAALWEDGNVEVDTTQYIKKHFWTRVKSRAEYERFYIRTEFQLRYEPPVYFYTKSALEKGRSVTELIREGLLYFKKFYNQEVGAEGEEGDHEGHDDDREGEDENSDEQQPVPGSETDMDMLELEAEAELELLKLRLELERKKKANPSAGLDGIDPDKLDHLLSKARLINGQQTIPDFK